jgi:hypothetical protein
MKKSALLADLLNEIEAMQTAELKVQDFICNSCNDVWTGLNFCFSASNDIDDVKKCFPHPYNWLCAPKERFDTVSKQCLGVCNKSAHFATPDKPDWDQQAC